LVAGELLRTQKQNTQIKSAHTTLEKSYNTVATNVIAMQQEYSEALEQSDTALQQTQRDLTDLSQHDQSLREALAHSYQNATIPELKGEISELKAQVTELSNALEKERTVQAEIDSVKGVLEEMMQMTASRLGSTQVS